MAGEVQADDETDQILLSEEAVEEYKEAFQLFDENGTIKSKDMGSVLRALGHSPTEAEIDELITKLNENGQEKLDFDGFLDLMRKRGLPVSPVDILKDALRVFDKEGYGYVSAGDLRSALVNLGEVLSEQEVEDLIKEADVTGDGVINYEDFAKLLTK